MLLLLATICLVWFSSIILSDLGFPQSHRSKLFFSLIKYWLAVAAIAGAVVLIAAVVGAAAS